MTFPERAGLTGAKAALKPYTGPATVTGDERRSDCVVSSQIRVAAGGQLTLTNCWVKVNVGDDGTGMIGGPGRIDLTHVLLDASTGAETLPLRFGGGFSEIISTGGIQVRGAAAHPVTIEWNTVHAPVGNPAHVSGVSVSGGAGPVLIAHNLIDLAGLDGAAGSVQIVTDDGPIDGVRVEGNTFRPGGPYALYVRTDGSCGCGGVQNVVVRDNRWFADAGHRWGGLYGAFSVSDDAGVTTWSGNTLTRPDSSTVALPASNSQP
jgi:hypothetical protein